jgi:hypothetical protein
MRFVLLQHDAPAETMGPNHHLVAHWDFMVEVPGQERLATWRLSENPVTAAGPIAAERIADHRREYLTYEGEISDGRGAVRRLDGGDVVVERLANDELVARLAGARLLGVYACQRSAAGLLFSRL